MLSRLYRPGPAPNFNATSLIASATPLVLAASHTYSTRTLSRRANTRMLLWLGLSALAFCLLIALAPPQLRELLAWLLAFVPAGGYVLLSWLYLREITYTVGTNGLTVVHEPAHPDFTLIPGKRWTYAWSDILEFAEGDTLVLGRYGYLEIWVRHQGQEHCLRLSPGRKREIQPYDEFVEAFRREVEVLNADQNARAVAVATIHRRASWWDKPIARPVAIAITLTVVGLYMVDIFTQFDDATEWRLAYLYLLLFPLAIYALRRSFYRASEA